MNTATTGTGTPEPGTTTQPAPIPTATAVQAILDRALAASDGPWRDVDCRHQKGGQIRIFGTAVGGHLANVLASGDTPAATAAFIAAARDDVPALATALLALLRPMVLTASDPEPDLPTDAICVVNYGNSGQMVFVAADDGYFSLLTGGNCGSPQVVDDPRTYAQKITSRDVWRQPWGTIPTRPQWRDMVALGPVTVLAAGAQEMYQRGWTAGREALTREFEQIAAYNATAPNIIDPEEE